MYSSPREVPLKESELMCLQKQLLTARNLSQQPSYIIPPRAFLHHRFSCLNQVEAREKCSICHVKLQRLMNIKLDHIMVAAQCSSRASKWIISLSAFEHGCPTLELALRHRFAMCDPGLAKRKKRVQSYLDASRFLMTSFTILHEKKNILISQPERSEFEWNVGCFATKLLLKIEKLKHHEFGSRGIMVVRWLTLFPHSKKVTNGRGGVPLSLRSSGLTGESVHNVECECLSVSGY